jgi:hypothetical protein
MSCRETAMTAATRPNRLNIDLKDLKQPWLDYCLAHGVTPSEAIRQVVAKLTKVNPPKESPPEGTERRLVRREIRLTQSEEAGLRTCAAREGFSASRWIVALIRARLNKAPQLGQRELELLAMSNLQLLAIGRNLNQLARAANSGIAIDDSGRDMVGELRKAISQHTERVAGVITENVSRWST